MIDGDAFAGMERALGRVKTDGGRNYGGGREPGSFDRP